MDEIINQILKALNDGMNVIIVGKKGSGKSYLLMELNKRLENSIYLYIPRFHKDYVEKLFNQKFDTIFDMAFFIIFKSNKVWLIDNYEFARPIDKLLIKDLAKTQKLVIAVEKLKNFEFYDKHFYVVDLNKYRIKKIEEIVNRAIKDSKLVRLLYKVTGKNPLLVYKFLPIVKKYGDIPKEYRVKKRENPLVYLFAIAYLLLFARYLFLKVGEFDVFIMLSVLAYVLIFLNKLKWII